MAAVVEAGVNSFKFFFAYKGSLMVGDELYLDGLLRCKQLGALPMASSCPLDLLCTSSASSAAQ